MSDANQPREVVLLPDAAVLKVKVTVQCGTMLAEPDEANPHGVYCGNVIEGEEVEITFEPGIAAELGIECPACSARISEGGAPLQAVIPIALLVGQQVEDSLDAEGDVAEEEDDEDAVDEVEEPQGVVELTPEDQQ